MCLCGKCFHIYAKITPGQELLDRRLWQRGDLRWRGWAGTRWRGCGGRASPGWPWWPGVARWRRAGWLARRGGAAEVAACRVWHRQPRPQNPERCLTKILFHPKSSSGNSSEKYITFELRLYCGRMCSHMLVQLNLWDIKHGNPLIKETKNLGNFACIALSKPDSEREGFPKGFSLSSPNPYWTPRLFGDKYGD